MPNNYVLLEKIVVGSAGASSVTFANIPQTGYTDLVLKMSARNNSPSVFGIFYLYFNGTTTNYSSRNLEGNGSTAGSGTTTVGIYLGAANGANATSNTFANIEAYIPNYTGSTNKSVSIDSVGENNATTSYMNLNAGLWSNTSAITSLTVDGTGGGSGYSFIQGSTFYLYGVAKLGTTPTIAPKATGGDIVMTDGTYWYHTFLSSGTFTPAVALTTDYLVVAGGGGGGSRWAGGGGAGGLRSTVTATGGGGSLESALALASGTGYTVTIGAGGAGGAPTSNRGASGSNSVFSTITSTGGGGGGTSTLTPTTGGAGGGGGFTAQNGAAGTTNQGYAGGNSSTTTVYAGGGGGGASAIGANAVAGSPSQAGAGGAGVATSISGSSVTYAGGGGGGAEYGGTYFGAGGTGGGGNGSSTTNGTGSAGTANRGGGGGGGGNDAGTGGAGGSGIVVVRYLVA